MKYLVIEIQKQANGNVGNIVNAFDDKVQRLISFSQSALLQLSQIFPYIQ